MITKEYLLHLFDYDRERGVLIWKNPSKYVSYSKGAPAGYFKKATLVTKIEGVEYKNSDLIYFIENGFWPKKQNLTVLLTKEFLFNIFDYDSENDNLIWKNPIQKQIKGKIAGSAPDQWGHKVVKINGKGYRVKKIIKILKGEPLEKGCKVEAFRNVSIGNGNLKGVSQTGKNKFRAYITQKNGRNKHLGVFRTQQEAHERYLKELEALKNV